MRFPFVVLLHAVCSSPFLCLCLCVAFAMYSLFNATEAVHDEHYFLCRVEFDRLTDLLRARTIESDPPKSIVSREEKNEESIRIDGIGGSALRHMDLDDSPAVKVRIQFAHTRGRLVQFCYPMPEYHEISCC